MQNKKMKKIIAFILVFTLSFGAVTNVSALNNSVVYSYSYKDYETTILKSFILSIFEKLVNASTIVIG